MGITSISVDSVPSKAFTPQDHLVELLRICLEKNSIPFLSEDFEKPFLITWLIKERSKFTKDSSTLILVENEKKVSLWSKYISSLTLFTPKIITENEAVDIAEDKNEKLIVSTVQGLESEAIKSKKLGLLIIDNAHRLMLEEAVRNYTAAIKNQKDTRIICFPYSLLRDSHNAELLQPNALKTVLETLFQEYPSNPESCSDLMSMLRYFCSPIQQIIEYQTNRNDNDDPTQTKNIESVEDDINKIVENCYAFLRNHHYSLLEIWGSDFIDMIDDEPDPTELPLKLLNDFVHIKKTLGLWCAERAALLLIIKIDRLKTREKSERHYLLFSVLYTEMVRVRKICETAFNDLSDYDRLIKYSTPQLLKLVEILRQYKPEHVCRSKAKSSVPPKSEKENPEHEKSEPEKVENETTEPEKSELEKSGTDKLEPEKSDLESKSSDPEKSEYEKSGLAEKSETGKRPHQAYTRRNRNKGTFSSYEDPNSLCGVIFVEDKFTAKLLYHFVKDLSRSDDIFSFLMPQYATDLQDDSANEAEALDTEIERKKQEDSLRRFRMRECNLLISSSLLEVGVDGVRCNLVVAFDPPRTFGQFANYKVKAKGSKAFFLVFCPEGHRMELLRSLDQFCTSEALLKSYCTMPGISSSHSQTNFDYGSHFNMEEKKLNPFLSINRYCTKLPSDTFTRLTPLYGVELIDGQFKCKLILPINSPLRKTIEGPIKATIEEAQFSTALEACHQLRQIHELDEQWNPLGRENRISKMVVPSSTVTEISTLSSSVPNQSCSNDTNSSQPTKASTENEIQTKNSCINVPGRPGTTKRRQYYFKRMARSLTHVNNDESNRENSMKNDVGNKTKSHIYHLYALKMRLTCAIPDEQNTRGRKIHPPEEAAHCFGILIQSKMPPICEFPIYTRDGEIFVETLLISSDLALSEDEKTKVLQFHKYTFSQVLRLEKFPMLFQPDAEPNSSVLVVPLSNSLNRCVDWNYLSNIDYEKCNRLEIVSESDRAACPIREENFHDAVVTPWYRNQDQPQYFYVAEICGHLSPNSDFPGQGFDTFEKYYKDKYQINIQHLDQPLLDVDHTSARLNFLTPRYVNRKGVALPTSSEETKRNKRENLEQKQILVPELCTIHPFPASLWRQAVCLPCVLYRLNSLLIADSLRRLVSSCTKLGIQDLSDDFKWPSLTFGWTLADVIKNTNALKLQQSSSSAQETPSSTSSGDVKPLPEKNIHSTTEKPEKETTEEKTRAVSPLIVDGNEELGDLSTKLLDKLNKEESKLRQQSNLEIGTWTNEMAQLNMANKRNGHEDIPEEEFEDMMDMFDPNIALPDNLTFIDDTVLPQINPEGNRRDWGTGIAQKKFRVGSPTFFANGINIPGLMDDMDGFSCSDSEDEDFYGENGSKKHYIDDSVAEIEDVGRVRIEYRGRNLAEAKEDEEQAQSRMAILSKNREEDLAMITSQPWDIQNMDLVSKCDDSITNSEILQFEKDWILIKSDDIYDRNHKALFSSSSEKSSIDSSSIKSLSLPLLKLPPNWCEEKKMSASKNLPLGLLPRDSDMLPTFSFDFQPNLTETAGPSPSLLLQAVTMSNSNDVINLERLETIGDSFLKYAVTSYLYCTFPNIHEGKLSHLRSKQVSNLNLFRLGGKKNLGELMIATKFEPHDNWLPPGYHVPKHFEQALINSGVPETHWNMAVLGSDLSQLNTDEISAIIKEKNITMNAQKQLADLPSFVPYNLLTQHSIPDKSIADCVEALIGAYLISCGQKGALLLMTWLGLTVLPECKENEERILDLPIPSTPLLKKDSVGLLELDFLLDGFQYFEELIGYRFKDRSYLLQAFSHASYYPNRLTDCYQRLEFLGDAVLDYLITRHLFEDKRQHSPGTLTDLRSALVNNTIFATLAVKFEFHKYFLHFSPGLHAVISRFVKIQLENGHGSLVDDFFLMDDEDVDEAEDVEVPKALGDIFESVAGAIFIDSGLSLDAVWGVYYRMMRESIDLYSSNVPKSPIREILELEPETAQFGKPEKLADGRRVRCTLEIIGKGVFKGIGRSYRIAKCTAAKCALRAIKTSKGQSS